MLATLNFWGPKPTGIPRRSVFASWGFWLAVLLAGNPALWARPAASPRDELPKSSGFAQEKQVEYQAAKQKLQKDPFNPTNQMDFGRACFDWADYAPNKAMRAEVAQEGVEVCQQWAEAHPDSGPAHYYLALNLGQLASTKEIGALKLVSQMEGELKLAARLDEAFDFAGADRSLGLLYLEAPGWPLSVGSKSKARQHLQRAVQLSPGYPGNRLDLTDAYVRWGDRPNAFKQLADLHQEWESDRQKFSGPAWASSWSEWEQLRSQIEHRLNESSKSANNAHDSD